MRAIRAKAIGIFRRGGRILVAHATDAGEGRRDARPLGGTIDFGERAADALRREIQEELGLALREPRLLGVIESLFVLEGRPEHEIVFVFDAEFVDESAYARPTLPIRESGWEANATWAFPEDLRRAGTPLYPEGLLDLLAPAS